MSFIIRSKLDDDFQWARVMIVVCDSSDPSEITFVSLGPQEIRNKNPMQTRNRSVPIGPMVV